MAHGRDPGGKERVLRLAGRLDTLDRTRGRLYYDAVLSALPKRIQEEIKEMALSGKVEYQSVFAKHFYGEGLEKGREQGRREAEAQALLAVLTQRGFVASEAHQARIDGATDEELQQWLVRAVDAKSVDEVFED